MARGRTLVKGVTAIVGKRARGPAFSTTKVRSSQVRLEAFHLMDTYMLKWEDKTNVRNISQLEMLRAASGHPLVDFVSENDGANFMVAWPRSSNDSVGCARIVLKTLDGISQRESIQVTSPFHFLDGREDKLASLCVVRGVGQTTSESTQLPLMGWGPPEEWLNYYSTAPNH